MLQNHEWLGVTNESTSCQQSQRFAIYAERHSTQASLLNMLITLVSPETLLGRAQNVAVWGMFLMVSSTLLVTR